MSAARTAKAPTSVKSSPSKPAAKPAPKPVETKAAAVPASQLGIRRRPTEVEEGADDEMITADQEALKRAYPVSRKPAKGCSHKIVCPMCEAPGFIPVKAAGRDVKCHNPVCMVPIFMAPAIEKKAEPEPESSGVSPLVYVGVVVGVLVLGGGGWFLFLRQKPSTNPPGVVVQNPPENGETNDDGKTETPIGDGGSDVIADKTPSSAKIQKDALKELAKDSRRVPRSRKPTARRWCAEAAARIGDIAEAKKQILQLETVGKTLPFLKTTPLVEIGWQQLKAGNRDALEKALAEAQQVARTLRPQGRFRYEAAPALASLLAAVGQDAEARALLAKHKSSSPNARLAAGMILAQQVVDFDFAAADRLAPIGSWQDPQYSVIPAVLVAHDQPDIALAWAKRATDAEVRAEAMMAWAETLIRRSPETGLSANMASVRSEAEQLSVPGQALLLGRLAVVSHAAGRNDVAEQLLAAAVSALDGYEVPPPLIFSDKKAVIRYRFPNQSLVRLAARASAEVARTQVALGKTDAGLKSLERGLQFARAIAPSPVAAQSWMDEISAVGPAMPQLLKNQLNLPNLDVARRQFATYKRYCDRLMGLASDRFDLQVAMVEAALSVDALDGLVELVQRADTLDAPESREPFMATKLPWLFAAEYKKANQPAPAEQLINDAANQRSGSRYLAVSDALAAGQFRGVAAALGRLDVSEAERSRLVLSLLAQLVREDRWKEALEICLNLEQETLLEEGLLLVSAQASVKGHAHNMFTYAKQTNSSPTERVSFHAGIILGTSLIQTKQSAGGVATENESAAAAPEN